MTQKETTEKVSNILKECKTHSNKDLIFAMDFIKDEFEVTKENLIKLTHHLDGLELAYNKILEEFESRNKK